MKGGRPSRSTGPLALRYTDHAIRGIPWWRVDYVRIIHADPNPFPRMLRLWPRRRR